MADREKVIKGLEICTSRPCYCTDCPYRKDCVLDSQELMEDALELLKEQEKLVNVDELRDKLGFAKDCAKCKQNSRHCQYDSHFSLMDFCERLDMAIEELT